MLDSEVEEMNETNVVDDEELDDDEFAIWLAYVDLADRDHAKLDDMRSRYQGTWKRENAMTAKGCWAFDYFQENDEHGSNVPQYILNAVDWENAADELAEWGSAFDLVGDDNEVHVFSVE